MRVFGLSEHLCRDRGWTSIEVLRHDVELRVMPSLWELREEVINSTMQYSIIRMRNAKPPPGGLGRFHPLPE